MMLIVKIKGATPQGFVVVVQVSTLEICFYITNDCNRKWYIDIKKKGFTTER